MMFGFVWFFCWRDWGGGTVLELKCESVCLGLLWFSKQRSRVLKCFIIRKAMPGLSMIQR